MNKKLIKAIASITCGLGLVNAIPLATSSCSKAKDEETITGVSLKLVGGSDSIVDHKDDFVDYLIIEPKSPNTGNRKTNGHSVVKFEFSDPTASKEAIKGWFDGYDPSQTPTPHPEDPDWKKEWPVYGFHYDEAKDQWHFKFKMAVDPSRSFDLRININVSVHNKDSLDTYDSPDAVISFKDPSMASTISAGYVSNFLYTFNKQTYKNFNIKSLAQKFLAPNTLVSSGGPGPNESFNLDLWSSFMLDKYKSQYSANLFAFFYVLESFNFIKYAIEASNEEMYYPQWDSTYNTFLIPVGTRDQDNHPDHEYKLSATDLENLSVTVNINKIQYNPSSNSEATVGKTGTFIADCSTTIKVGQDQKTAVCAYVSRDSYISTRSSPPVVCTSKCETQGAGTMHLESMPSPSSYYSVSYFITKMAGNFKTEIIDHPEYEMFNAFHYITANTNISGSRDLPCYNEDGVKNLLVALFPNYDESQIVPNCDY